MFTIKVNDFEGDTLNLTVDFDDGSVPTVLNFKPGANETVTKFVNHSFAEGRANPYHVVATVDDGMIQYHFVKSWSTASSDVSIPEKKSNVLLYVGIGIAVAIVVLLLVFVLMKRRKEPQEEAGMEGMKPPEEPPAT